MEGMLMPIQSKKKAHQAQMMPPESPKVPMEYLSRTWSVSALEVCKALSSSSSSSSSASSASSLPPHHQRSLSKSALINNNVSSSSCHTPTMRESFFNEDEITAAVNCAGLSAATNHFSFNSAATSQLVLERIMSQSEVSPLTSGRLSHSSGPLNGTDSPPISASPSDDFDDIVKYFRSHNTLQPLFTGGRSSSGTGATTPAGAKTVGRWLKDRKERKKEEARAQNAQLHAAVSVASVAAAVAAFAAAAASASSANSDEPSVKMDMAVASAATLVAAQCVEAAEAMGAEREHLASVVSSAVNVRSHDDITTLTAAAATALRGAATLKARTMKEVWNIAAVLPVEKGVGACVKGNTDPPAHSIDSDEIVVPEKDFLGVCIKEFLARGSELLKRTRKGDLHWKVVSVYINRTGQVILKMKSKHVASTITKKKKNVVLEVCKDVPAWPGRYLFEGGEQRRYFGLKTSNRGVVEFECKNRREYEIWTQGVSSLLSIAAERRKYPEFK